MSVQHFPTQYLRKLGAIIMAGFILLQTGCSIVPSNPSLTTYVLPAASPTEVPNLKNTKWALQVSVAKTNQFLNTARIVVQSADSEMMLYKGIRWNDRVPVLVRDRIIDGFRNYAHLSAVSSDDELLQTDFELSSYLAAYQLLLSKGKPRAVLIQYSVKLINIESKRVIVAQTFTIEKPVNDKFVSTMIEAFGAATDQLTEQVVTWTAQQINAREDMLRSGLPFTLN